MKAYNEREHSSMDAKTFFVEKYSPLFFGSSKYMQWVQNSPLVQMKKGQKVETLGPEERKKKLSELISKIEDGARDASVAIGYSASEENKFATTSGQVSDIRINMPDEDVYLSWIGSSLGVGVQGGYSILFYDPQILLAIYDGWSLYRMALDTIPALKGNQISSWNGQWLAHRFDSDFDSDCPTAGFNYLSVPAKDGTIEVNSTSWTSVLIHMASVLRNRNVLGYVYNLGQMNTTIGFIPFNLLQIRTPDELYKRFFGTTGSRNAEKYWGTAFGFEKACQAGVIGLRALEPKGLREYIDKGKMPRSKGEQDTRSKGEQDIKFNTYKIWIMAMLNNEDLWSKAEQFACTLHEYALSSVRGKTDKSNKVKDLLDSLNKKQFIERLTLIVQDIADKDAVTEIARTVNLMAADNVPYFLTLIRFQYAAMSKDK